MARPVARTVQDWSARAGYLDPGSRYRPDVEGLIDISDVTGGMVLDVPRQHLPGNSFVDAKNARVRDGVVGRREGTVEFGPTHPDSDPVDKVLTFIDTSGNNYLLRFTRSGVYVLRPDFWQRIGDGLPVGNRISFSQMYGRIFAINGGRLRVVEIDKGQVVLVEGSPRGDFVTSFGDRILVARRFASTIWWSANLDPYDWESETAGQETLVQNTSDISDTIAGIFGLGRELVILRSRSIWIADRQAVAISPFRFSPLVDDLGCDMPHSAVRVKGGIAFANFRQRQVFFYQPNARPEPISRQVSREIFKDIPDLDLVEAGYDPFHSEYVLGMPNEDGLLEKVWRFNFDNGSWVYDEVPPVRSLGEVSSPSPLLMIDDLEGTIEGLEGVIDDLGREPGAKRSWVFMGGPEGEVIQFDEELDLDWDLSQFEMVLESQDLGHQVKVRSFMDFMLRTSSTRPGVLQFGLRGTGNYVERARVFDEDVDLVRYPKPRVQGLDLRFRLRCSEGDFKFHGYSVRLHEKGLARP